MKKPIQIFAFWPYDVFPYCAGGEVEKLDNDVVTVKGFGRLERTSRVVLVPAGIGRDFNVRLREMAREHSDACRKVNDEFNARLAAEFASYNIAQPK